MVDRWLVLCESTVDHWLVICVLCVRVVRDTIIPIMPSVCSEFIGVLICHVVNLKNQLNVESGGG